MNDTLTHPSGHSKNLRYVICAAVYVATPNLSNAQPASLDECSESVNPRQLVETSREWVESAAPGQAVLRDLACIAQRAPYRRTSLGRSAVRAVFAVAEDDDAIRQTLLQIIQDNATDLSVLRTACRLLVYVADEQTRLVMLDRLRSTWPTDRWGPYFAFFEELGDRQFLVWLEQTSSDPQYSQFPSVLLEQSAARVRIQQDPKDLAAYLASGRDDLDRGWVMRQALRRGVDPKAVREAVLASLRHSDTSDKRLVYDAKLVYECDECGLFLPEDSTELARRRTMARALLSDVDEPRPGWANPAIAAKRAEFYRYAPKHEKEE